MFKKFIFLLPALLEGICIHHHDRWIGLESPSLKITCCLVHGLLILPAVALVSRGWIEAAGGKRVSPVIGWSATSLLPIGSGPRHPVRVFSCGITCYQLTGASLYPLSSLTAASWPTSDRKRYLVVTVMCFLALNLFFIPFPFRARV